MQREETEGSFSARPGILHSLRLQEPQTRASIWASASRHLSPLGPRPSRRPSPPRHHRPVPLPLSPLERASSPRPSVPPSLRFSVFPLAIARIVLPSPLPLFSPRGKWTKLRRPRVHCAPAAVFLGGPDAVLSICVPLSSFEHPPKHFHANRTAKRGEGGCRRRLTFRFHSSSVRDTWKGRRALAGNQLFVARRRCISHPRSQIFNRASFSLLEACTRRIGFPRRSTTANAGTARERLLELSSRSLISLRQLSVTPLTRDDIAFGANARRCNQELCAAGRAGFSTALCAARHFCPCHQLATSRRKWSTESDDPPSLRSSSSVLPLFCSPALRNYPRGNLRSSQQIGPQSITPARKIFIRDLGHPRLIDTSAYRSIHKKQRGSVIRVTWTLACPLRVAWIKLLSSNLGSVPGKLSACVQVQASRACLSHRKRVGRRFEFLRGQGAESDPPTLRISAGVAMTIQRAAISLAPPASRVPIKQKRSGMVARSLWN